MVKGKRMSNGRILRESFFVNVVIGKLFVFLVILNMTLGEAKNMEEVELGLQKSKF